MVVARAVLALDRTHETEINDLQVKKFVDEYILRLEISVCEAQRVQVVHTLQQLLEIVAADRRTQSTLFNDILEKFTAFD